MKYKIKLTSNVIEDSLVFILKDLDELYQCIRTLKNERDIYNQDNKDLIDRGVVIEVSSFMDKDND
jgi:hypothetical protein